MRPAKPQSWQRIVAFGLLPVALALSHRPASAQAPAQDPVERLRLVLHNLADPTERERASRECIGALRTPGELRRALSLSEWRDRLPDTAVGAVDLANRGAVCEQFQQVIRQVFARHESTSAVVAIEMLADMAAAAHAAGEPAIYLRPFGPDLADLVRRAPPKVQVPAARTLGVIDADVAVAVPVLAGALQSKDPALRCAAADGLHELLLSATSAATRDGPRGRSAAERQVAVAAACAVVPAAGGALADWHVEVRRRCVGTIGAAASALGRLIPDPASGAAGDADVAARSRAEREEVRPLAHALRVQGPALAKALRDGDPEVRLLAQKALQEVADARVRWLRHGGPGTGADDPLLDGLTAALPALGEAVADGDLRVRRTSLDVLEALGPAAAPALPALARALQDPDRFIRWSAVRTLGAMGPTAARVAVPGLTMLLDDEDLDLRKAAADALQRLDPSATGARPPAGPGGAAQRPVTRSAVPALIRSVRAADPEMRLTAIRALSGMGVEAKPAVPALREALGDRDGRVRQAAAEALGTLGPLARDATDDLRGAMSDATPEVRRAAGDALLSVLRTTAR